MGTKNQTTTDNAVDAAYHNEPIDNSMYDDIQGSLSASRVGVTAPTARNYDFGLVPSVDFRVLGFDVGETATLTLQTPHRVELDSVMEFHMHWCPDGDATGKKIKVQVDVIAAGVGAAFAAVAGSPFTLEISPTADESGDHVYTDIVTLPASNPSVSSLYLIKITRIAASADEFSGDAILLYADAHALHDQIRGSRQEAVK